MKVLKIVSISVFLGGIALVLIGLIFSNGDFSSLKEVFLTDSNYEQVVYSGEEEVNSIDIYMKTNNIEFYKSTDESYNISFYKDEDDVITFSVEEGVLTLKDVTKYTFKFFNWGFRSRDNSKMIVYLPKSFTGIIKAHTSTGDIKLNNFEELESLMLSVSTGDINVSNIKVLGNLDAKSSTGDVVVSNTIVLGNTLLDTSTGDVEFNGSETKYVRCISSTGDVEVIDSISDEIYTKTSTGSIKIEFTGDVNEYQITASTNTGYIKYQDSKVGKSFSNNNGSKIITARNSTGNVFININQ